MKNNERGFCVFYDWMDCLEYLPRATAAEVLFALRDYYIAEEDPSARFEGAERALVKMMLAQIKRAEARSARGEQMYSETEAETKTETETEAETEKNKETKTILLAPTRSETEKETTAAREAERDSEAPIEGEQEGERETFKLKDGKEAFVVPTLRDVKDYALFEDLCFVDPSEFYDYNCRRAWRIDGEPIMDWRAALRRWNAKRKAIHEAKMRKEERKEHGVSARDEGASEVRERGEGVKRKIYRDGSYIGADGQCYNAKGQRRYGDFDVIEAFERALKRSYGDEDCESVLCSN